MAKHPSSGIAPQISAQISISSFPAASYLPPLALVSSNGFHLMMQGGSVEPVGVAVGVAVGVPVGVVSEGQGKQKGLLVELHNMVGFAIRIDNAVFLH